MTHHDIRRRFAASALATVLALPGLALAQEPDPRAWRGELRLDLPFTASTNEAHSTTTRATTLAPALDAAYFAQPLMDDRAEPLSLQRFLQHPDTIEASAQDSVPLTPAGTSTWLGSLSTAVYPWRSFGGTASITMVPSATALTASYSAGALIYLRPTLQLSLLYVGRRSLDGHAAQTTASSKPDEVVESLTSSDRAHLGVRFLLFGNFMQVGVEAEFGNSRLNTASAVSSTSVFFQSVGVGPDIQGGLAVSFYPGRRLSVTLSVAGHVLERDAQNSTHLATQSGTIDLSGGVSAAYFLTDCLFVGAAYVYDNTQNLSSAGGDLVTSHRALGSLGIRI